MRRSLLALLLLPGLARADAPPPLLLQRPAVSAKQVAFVYAGDLWIVDRAGGDARRLTAGVGLESYPVFSPDGAQVAFAGEYDGNLDVYVVPAAGGVPRRLTYHPDPDVPVGWTPDGKSVLFRSPRSQLRPVPPAVHRPGRRRPADRAAAAAWPRTGRSRPDGKRIAYVPLSNKPQFPGAFRAGAELPRRHAPRRSGSPTWPTRRSRRCRGPTPTTSTRCGSATASTSCPTATGRPRCSPTTRPSKEVKRVLDPDGARHQVGVRLRRRHRLRPVRHAAPVRPEDREVASRCR